MGVGQSHCFHDIVTFQELAENDLNNIRFVFLDPDSMHRCLETGNAGKEKIGVFVPHELNSLQLRHKQMPLGWVKGQRPLPHCPQSIRNGVTLVQTILERSTGSCFANVPQCPSVFRDKGLAEMAKNVCVVNAADYSYMWSVKGDSVSQTLVGYKNLKTFFPSDVYVRRAFHGEFRYNTPRNIRQTLPQTTTGTHSTCPHGTHSRSRSSSTISQITTTLPAQGCAQRSFSPKPLQLRLIFPFFCFSGFLFPLRSFQVSSQNRNILSDKTITL